MDTELPDKLAIRLPLAQRGFHPGFASMWLRYNPMSASPSLHMPPTADIVLDSPLQRRVLVVECKLAKEASPEGAARLRRSLYAHRLAPEATFFMLALPTALYLWKKDSAPDALPDFASAAKPVLRDYLGKIADQAGGPRGESLELAISSWLSDLASRLRKPNSESDADQMLVASGLYEQMKDGVVRTEFEP
jgi:hypothetical protein